MSPDSQVIPGADFLLTSPSYQNIFTAEDFSEEQLMFQKSVIDFIESEVVAKNKSIEKKDFQLLRDILKKGGELGIHQIDIPERFGGLELDKTTSCLVAESMARNGSVSVTFGAHNGIGLLPLIMYGTDFLKQKYLQKIATAEMVAAYALTEAGSGSDALGAKTIATLSPDGKYYILNGSKMWITNGGFADIFTVFAKVDGEKFTAFLVEKNSEGFTIGHDEHKMGIRGSSTTALSFENVKVPVENVLGTIGQGHKIAFNILNFGRLKLGVGALGGSKNLLKVALKYAVERKQFHTPLSEFELIKNKVANMGAMIFALESMCYRTSGLIDRYISNLKKTDPEHYEQNAIKGVEEYAVESSILKVFGSETLDFTADESLQIHGGYGYSEEYLVEQGYRDSRINRIFEGTNEINRMLIPGMILKRAMQGKLSLMEHSQEVFTRIQNEQFHNDDIVRGILEEEQQMVFRARMAVTFVLQTAVMKHMNAIDKHQQILADAADLLMRLYAMDSSVLRAIKYAKSHQTNDSMYQILAQYYIHTSFEQLLPFCANILREVTEISERNEAYQSLNKMLPMSTLPLQNLRDLISKHFFEKLSYHLA